MAEYIINSPSSSQVTVPAKDNHHIGQQKQRGRDRSPESKNADTQEIRYKDVIVEEVVRNSPKVNKAPLVQLEARAVAKNKN
jgi:hypothetical protein